MLRSANGGYRPDGLYSNAVSHGALADGVAVGPAAFLSLLFAKQLPDIKPCPNCVLRQPPTSRSELRQPSLGVVRPAAGQPD